MRATEFITEGRSIDPDLIRAVKAYWDENQSPIQISKKLDLSYRRVMYILSKYYFNREGKFEYQKFPSETIKDIFDAKKENMANDEIADALGLTSTQVSYVLSFYPNNPVIHGNHRWEEEEKKAVKTLLDNGLSIEEIGTELGMKKTQVTSILLRYYPHRSNKRKLNKVSSELKQEILNLRKQRLSVSEISRKLGRSIGTVRNIVNNYKDELPLLKNKVTPEMDQEILNLRKQGISPSEISIKLNQSINIVKNVLAQYKGEYPQLKNKVTPELRQQILDLRKQGISPSEISRRLGQSINSIRNVVINYKDELPLLKKYNRVTPELIQNVLNLRKQGVPYVEISNKLNLTANTIKYIINSNKDESQLLQNKVTSEPIQ